MVVATGSQVACGRMRALTFIGILLFSIPCLQAGERGAQVWLDQADSLRNAGQDAAALDFLNSAEQQFRRAGEDCWVARFAERRARVHLDWQNPVHASEASILMLVMTTLLNTTYLVHILLIFSIYFNLETYFKSILLFGKNNLIYNYYVSLTDSTIYVSKNLINSYINLEKSTHSFLEGTTNSQ